MLLLWRPERVNQLICNNNNYKYSAFDLERDPVTEVLDTNPEYGEIITDQQAAMIS